MMKHFIHTLLIIIACAWSVQINAQTPFDSFAPEVSRPMLELDKSRDKQPDSIVCAIVADLQGQMLLLVDISNGEVVSAAPITDEIQKWLSVDPLADKNPGVSPYAYCGWNPISRIDPDGRDWYDTGDGSIIWNDKATSQKAMDKAGIQGIYLGKNVLVGKHGRDANLNEKINGAVFELYLETYKEGPIASIKGNTIPCDVDIYGTLKEGRYPAKYYEYKGRPAILINGGGNLPTVKGNPNNEKNYIDYAKKIMKPIEEHIMDQIFFHYGNNWFEGLKDRSGHPWSTGCQTGGNYKDAWKDYDAFMENVPTTFNGWYYLRSK